MEDDLRSIIANCGISATESRAVRERASEILRKMNTVVPQGSLGNARSCKSLLAIELACRVLNTMFIKENLMASTQVGARDFQKALQNCKQVLKLTFTKTSAIDVLAVQFGVEFKEPTLKLLQLYRQVYVAKLEKARRSLIDLESPAYQAAAFLVISKKSKKIKADKRRVCEICNLSSELVQNIIEDLESVRTKAEGVRDSADNTSSSSTSSSSGVGTKKLGGETSFKTKGQAKRKVSNLSLANKENLVGQRSNTMRVEMEAHTSSSTEAAKDPFISMIDRLTSRGDSASALAQDPKPSKPLHKHDFHEAARAKEASNKEEEEEKRKYSAKKKRERYENWKEGLKKKRRAI